MAISAEHRSKFAAFHRGHGELFILTCNLSTSTCDLFMSTSKINQHVNIIISLWGNIITDAVSMVTFSYLVLSACAVSSVGTFTSVSSAMTPDNLVFFSFSNYGDIINMWIILTCDSSMLTYDLSMSTCDLSMSTCDLCMSTSNINQLVNIIISLLDIILLQVNINMLHIIFTAGRSDDAES